MKLILKIIGYFFLTLSIGLISIGAWMFVQLVIHKFELGAHGVPHAIAFGGLFYGLISLAISALSFRYAKKIKSAIK